MEDVQIALSKDKRYLGNRFCNVVKSSAEDRDSAMEKQKKGRVKFCTMQNFYLYRSHDKV